MYSTSTMVVNIVVDNVNVSTEGMGLCCALQKHSLYNIWQYGRPKVMCLAKF